MTVQTTSIPKLNRPSVPVTGADIVHAYRASEVPGKQDIGIPVSDIATMLGTSLALQFVSLVNTVNALQAQVTLMVPLSQKGAANGVATLGSDGKVPAGQLSLTGSQFKGSWDSTTNTPTLADGTGTAGDWYFITGTTTVDLGSGNIDFVDGALVMYDGATWIQNSAVNSVISVNGKFGTIVLNTADIDPSADRNYVTDAILDALVGATNPSSVNPFVTRSELAAASTGTVNIVNSYYGPSIAEDNGRQAGRQTQPLMLSSLLYTNITASGKWPRAHAFAQSLGFSGIDVNTWTYDDAVLTEMMLAMEHNGYKTAHFPDNVCYQMLLPLGFTPLPVQDFSRDTYSSSFGFSFFMNRAAFRNRSGVAKIMFGRVPSTKSEADQNVLKGPYVETGIHMQDFAIFGANLGAGSGDIGIQLGATYHGDIHHAFIADCDVSMDLAMCLQSKVSQVRSRYAKSVGFKVRGTGSWTGAGVGDSVSQLVFDDCRSYCSLGSTAFDIQGSDLVTLNRPFIEGDNPAYGIKMNNLGGVTSKAYRITDFRIETNCTTAGIRLRGDGGAKFAVDGGYNAAKTVSEWTHYLFEFVNGGSTYNSFRVDDIGNYSGATWKSRYIMEDPLTNGGLFYMRNTNLLGNPVTAADVANAGSFPNIWDPAYNVPDATNIDFTCKY